MKRDDFVKLTKGDIVKNTYHHEVIKPAGGNEVGVVLEPPKKDDKYPQVLVWARTGGKNYSPSKTRDSSQGFRSWSTAARRGALRTAFLGAVERRN